MKIAEKKSSFICGTLGGPLNGFDMKSIFIQTNFEMNDI